jgi:hypothetical protein
VKISRFGRGLMPGFVSLVAAKTRAVSQTWHKGMLCLAPIISHDASIRLLLGRIQRHGPSSIFPAMGSRISAAGRDRMAHLVISSGCGGGADDMDSTSVGR